MKRIGKGLLGFALVSTCLTGIGHAQKAPARPGAKNQAVAGISIPYEEFTLPNGLKVIVHTDRTSPLVSVNLWFRVGSRNETPGHTGFAHLYEHLMFQGSENHKDEYFRPFEQVGATDRNGSTNTDYTNYFETVPTPALDMALWMESDRMGHLLGAIDQKALDEQRGVVQNEKRQRGGQPGAMAIDHILAGLYPEGHPYRHTPIGSMADLNAASLEDVKNWYRSWYGPNNAVLVLAGDIDLATAKEKVARYFGDIKPSASVPMPKPNIPVLTKDARETYLDRVTQNRFSRSWQAPEGASAEAPALTLFMTVFGGGSTSRLYKRLVKDEKVSTGAGAFYSGSVLAGRLSIDAAIKDGIDKARVEALIDEELKRLLAEGPTQAELDRARNVFVTRMTKALPKLAYRAQTLSECAITTGKADCWQDEMRGYLAATPESVRAAGQKWLTRHSFTLDTQKSDVAAASRPEPVVNITRAPVPVPPADTRFKASGPGVDRSTGVPQVTSFPKFDFPALQHARLSNGIELVLVERHNAPTVSFTLMMPGGTVADRLSGGKVNRASFAPGMMSAGTTSYDSTQLSERQQELGANVGSGASLTDTGVTLSALSARLPESLDLMADVLFHPSFDAREFERRKDQAIASIKAGKVNGQSIAGRLINPLLYGAGHPLGEMMTEQGVAALTRDDLIAFQQARIRPDGARIIIVGDTTMAQIQPMLEARFGAPWKPAGPSIQASAPRAALPAGARVILVDQPGAPQSQIFATQLIPESANTMESDAFGVANATLGGGFMSRLNLNLREDKHWSYGAGSGTGDGNGQAIWYANASVQADKTAESAKEMRGEIDRLANGTAPIGPADVKRAQLDLYSYPGRFDTGDAIGSEVMKILRKSYPEDYVEQKIERIRAMTPAQAQQAFSQAIHPEALTWIIVGPLDKIEASVRALGLGEVTVLDPDGNVVKKP
ncbi:pitrilysin family protein [Sphingomonas sp. HITSZ_GF]|uniref:M16 family metallopeptidase n=1 Tax=Sphingomonas sp. HITSZ_GF TaxID=3037247 RepID=UPI00240E5226|nr:pitrilysin family protein [Sphingomonas sp. HITSZ_GF]MDG2535183.1 pitrilysin family protein [Sphingomonas sp. HITSZ_GF]